MGLLSLLLPLFAFALATDPTTPVLAPLPALKIDPARVTVSGISSGAFFAVQFHVAHSALVKGAAAVAGGTYWCAEGEAKKAQKECMFKKEGVDPARGIERARAEAALGSIDPLAGLAASRAFVFSGGKDIVTPTGQGDSLAAFYGAFLPAGEISRVNLPDAPHGFITDGPGKPCNSMGIPWINNCAFDLAGAILNFLDTGAVGVAPSPGRFVFFDQQKFGGEKSLYPWGALYVPKACETAGAGCGLHVAFHGCQMNPDFIDRQFLEQAGYLKWADAKGIAVLFPQAAKTADNVPGCWDWFGLTGSDYANQRGPQIRAVREMVRAVSGL